MTELKNPEYTHELYKEGYEAYVKTQSEMYAVLRIILQDYLDEIYPEEKGFNRRIESNYDRIEIRFDSVEFGNYEYNQGGLMCADVILPALYIYDRAAWREEQRILREEYEANKKLEIEKKTNSEIAHLKTLMKKYPDVKSSEDSE